MKKLCSTYTKKEFSWILQDWANSAYSLMITTALFPIFYKSIATNAGVSDANSTAYLGYTNAIGTIAVAMMAPFLGTLADFPGYRKKLFTTATLLGVFSVLSMILIGQVSWQWLLVLYGFSAVGFSTANIFYDASLMDVTSRDRLDLVSSAGFGFGYIGSVIPFLIFMLLQFSGGLKEGVVVNIGFLLTAVWWFVFTIPYWKNVDQVYMDQPKQPHIIASTLASLKETLTELTKDKVIVYFLIGYFFYIDGVGTIIKMATSIGSDQGLTATQLILMLLVVQIVAFPCSIIYGILAKRWGRRTMLFTGIGTYILICLMALSLSSFVDFMIIAILVGSAQGGIQSLSRSYFGSIIPLEKNNQLFGIYNIFGKFSSVLGTTILGIITQLTGDSLKGLFVIVIQFMMGAFLLWKAKKPITKAV
ncbi:MFS transporter [Facklamia sp. P12945]|uniref:MFS transporter n=1 Tax=unclassified Facklamia TaxID=2622293 RepID=UPI003D176510